MRAIGYRGPGGKAAEFDELFREFCRDNFHQPVRIFVEPCKGTAQFEQMLGYFRDSGSEFLAVVPDAGHLGEDLEAVARSLVAIERTGSAVTCMDGEFPDPVQNAFQRLGVKGVSQRRSVRVGDAMKHRASQGKALGRPPFGYRIGGDGTLEVAAEQAEVVRLMYRLYTSEGLGYRRIAQHLNEAGITTRGGSAWNLVTVRDVLRNPVYTGTYQRFGMRLPRVHEAIIDAGTHRRAQDLMRTRRPRGRVLNSEPFILSGLVTCGKCGGGMMGVTRRQKWRTGSGRRGSGIYRYYQCQSRQNQGLCEYRTWRASDLESMVVEKLKDQLSRQIARVGRDPDAGDERLAHVRLLRREQVDVAERRLVRALRRVAKAEMPLLLIEEYLAELDSRRSRAEDRAEMGPADVHARLLAEPGPDLQELRGIIEETVNQIVVRDGEVEVRI